MKNKMLHVRMGFALNGLKLAFLSEKSVRFQTIVAISVIALLGVLQPSLIWWAIILIMIALVLFAELLNTAIEGLCDFVEPEHNEAIGKIKDVAAGAVFVLSVCSVFVGVIFLLDYLSR